MDHSRMKELDEQFKYDDEQSFINYFSSEWLSFYVVSKTDRSVKVKVCNKSSDDLLGTIKFFPSFRTYAFFSVEGTVFDTKCLGEIIKVIEGFEKIRKQRIQLRRERQKREKEL